MIAKNVYAYSLNHLSDPLAVFSSLYRFPYTQMVDGDVQNGHRYSTIVFQPVEIIEAWGDKVTVTNRDQQLSLKTSVVELLEERLRVWGHGKILRDPTLPPFQGGAVGYFGFGLMTAQGKPGDLPQAAFGLYEQCVAFDHQEKNAWYIVVSESAEQAQVKYNHFKTLAARQFMPARGTVQPQLSWVPATMPGAMKEHVRQLSDYIHAGSFNRSHLCQFYESRLPAGYDTLAHYSNIRTHSSAGIAGACLSLGGLSVIVAETEPCLTLIDRQIEATHISHRTQRPEGLLRDDVAGKSLAGNKDAQAQHRKQAKALAIKLSAYCPANGILGPSSPEVRAIGQEYMLSSTTRGVLANDVTLRNILGLISPADTYCGEPADRTLRVISGIEPFNRGPAFGHIALIGFNGSLSLLLNKEVVVNNSHELRYVTGLPVYGDTKPDQWYDELVKKAESSLRWIGDDAETREERTA
ncbi:MAG: chorismate-binding protein [Micavibrio aeruginosavorus]|uniref:Chorismate-binding protein n=1 Tax=Micavibrio aeruginosavorus TaxID=349221 RepID=A0A7T5UHK9_9BACT|nr:MAG: chorismate-binding protein [Micavibrio aeruginosavorus]